MPMLDDNEKLIKEAEKAGAVYFLKKTSKLTLDLIAFGWSCVAQVGAIAAQSYLLSFLAGVFMAIFAYRVISGILSSMIEFTIAAQKGTILGILERAGFPLKDIVFGLDKYDCGNPDCKACSPRREK